MDPFTAILVPFAVGLATRFVWNKILNYMQASKVAKAKAERLRLSVRHSMLPLQPLMALDNSDVYASFRAVGCHARICYQALIIKQEHILNCACMLAI